MRCSGAVAAGLLAAMADTAVALDYTFLVPPNSTAEAPTLRLAWGQTLYAEWESSWDNITLWFNACNGMEGQTVFVNEVNNNSAAIYLNKSLASSDGCVNNCDGCSNTFTLGIHLFEDDNPRFNSAPFDVFDSLEDGLQSGLVAVLTETLIPTATDGTPESTLVVTAVASAAVTPSSLPGFSGPTTIGTSIPTVATRAGGPTSPPLSTPVDTNNAPTGDSSSQSETLAIGLSVGLVGVFVLVGIGFWLWRKAKKPNPTTGGPAAPSAGASGTGNMVQTGTGAARTQPAADGAGAAQSKGSEAWRGTRYG